MKGRRRSFGTEETSVKRFHDQKDRTLDCRTKEQIEAI
jgi:hypothetical protein